MISWRRSHFHFQHVINYLYDRLARPENTNITRYGFLKKVTGIQLWAQSEWTKVKEEIDVHMAKENEHFLPSYKKVTRHLFNGLSEEKRDEWDLEAKNINEGNASDNAQALYVGPLLVRE